MSRLTEAREELDRHRAARAAAPRDLFRVPDQVEDDPAPYVESVTRHAGPEWNRHAFDAVRRAATDHAEFTVETVWQYVDEAVYDGRAIGGVMRRAARSGLIRSTDRYVHSERPEAHGRPLLVWRSQVWEPTR